MKNLFTGLVLLSAASIVSAEEMSGGYCKRISKLDTPNSYTFECTDSSGLITQQTIKFGKLANVDFARGQALLQHGQQSKNGGVVNKAFENQKKNSVKPITLTSSSLDGAANPNQSASLGSVSLGPAEKVATPSTDEDIKFKAFQKLMSFCKQENPNASEEECGKFAFAHYEELLAKKGYKKSESDDCPELKDGDSGDCHGAHWKKEKTLSDYVKVDETGREIRKPSPFQKAIGEIQKTFGEKSGPAILSK